MGDSAIQTIEYLAGDVNTGPRIGGSCPSGLEENLEGPHSQYFGTFPLLSQDGREFSLFHRFDLLGDDPRRDIIEHNNRILPPSETIWVVVHPSSERSDDSRVSCEPRGLILSEPRADELRDEDGLVTAYPDSKLGGSCFLLRYWLNDLVDQLERDGYQQLLQIGLHRDELIEGFPWDPGYLHVWSSQPRDPKNYRFMIEQ